ncbi:S-adenosyl-L-methionine-dependent methyltransferase [Testicularia cyperi]|uniref:type I protein arginine methyltransferase n=1 Tax=Testicularia cyperi TaxID=1882483 RepID=A0A317XQG6_9BASI|nr:S-adenosyl-L-methionine-dependent methyltransferase [Testicularia cyperi]
MVHKDPEGYVSDSGSGSGSGSGSEFDDQDHDFGDWCSDASNPSAPTSSLVPNADGTLPSFKSPNAALEHIKSQGCDLVSLVTRLQLDTLQVIRLINHARRNKLSVQQLNAIQGTEPWLNADQELKPVPGFEDDGLLQLDFDLLATEAAPHTAAAAANAASSSSSSSAAPTAVDQSNANLSPEEIRIQQLESQLASATRAFDELRSIHASSLGLSSQDLSESSSTPLSMAQRGRLASSSVMARTKRPEGSREDDTLYFDSYSTNSIHQTMITDSARTLSYAKFLLHPANQHLIRDKVVMDVGCGTGILSLFAARAGAKLVIAIDASDIVERAKQNVEANGFGHVVKVYRGKLEDLDPQLSIYHGKVDLLVSEWMGYFLLYENMLPSVLHARDLYLNKQTGILAPNKMSMHLAAFSSPPLLHTKIGFWSNVHGFNFDSMSKGLLDEAFVDTLDTKEVVTDSAVFANLDLHDLPVQQPEPKDSFSLTLQTDPHDNTVHGFISWFDTFFFPTNKVDGVVPDCPPFSDTEDTVPGLALSGNQVVSRPASASASTESPNTTGQKGQLVSFSTSPYSKETHWQQTLFVLKQPITNVQKGDTIRGEIIVTQDKKWSRELDVELHYLHIPSSASASASGAAGQEKKKVDAKLVQLFKVR